MKFSRAEFLSFIFILSLNSLADAGIIPVVRSSAGGLYVQITDDGQLVFSSLNNNSGLLIFQPSGVTEVSYHSKEESVGILSLSGGKANGLNISESYRTIMPGLIERVVKIKAESDQRYYIDFGWKAVKDGEFYSFLKEEKASNKYSPGCSGPEFGNTVAGQTFPFLGVRIADKLYGIIGDTPGLWENRSFLIL